MKFIKEKNLKWIISLAVCLALGLFLGNFKAFAAAYYEDNGEFDLQSQFEASGADQLADELPGYALDSFDKAGVDLSDISSIAGIKPEAVLHSVLSIAEEEISSPFASFGLVLVLLLVASVCKGGEQALDATLAQTTGTVISLAVGIILVVPVGAVVNAAGEAVGASCRFSESFAAVFVGILIANGQSVTAAGYSSFLFGATSAASVCVNDLVLPMLRIFLALSCISAVSGSVKIDAVIGLFEKYAKWILSFLAVIISAVLGISGILSASADSVSARAAKFIISGSVPVVGGAVGDAYLSIKSGMALLRNSVGAFGIIGVGYIFLPVILRTALWNAVTGTGEAICELLGLDVVGKMMKSLSATLSLLLGTLIFALFLLMISGMVVLMNYQY